MAAATKLTQSQIVKELAETTGVSTKVAKHFMTTFSELAIRETKKNGVFVLPGIGRLVRQDRKARTGRNPKTGAKVDVPAKRVPFFKPSKELRDSVNPQGVKKTAAAADTKHIDPHHPPAM